MTRTATFAFAILLLPSLTMANDWWQKGSGLDLWSIPHFLFGILMGTLPALTGMPFITVFLLTALLAVLWEIYEKYTNIRETASNILFDIVLSIAAYIFTSFMLIAYPLHRDDLLVVATAVLILYLFTNFSGWRAYRRRKHDFMH